MKYRGFLTSFIVFITLIFSVDLFASMTIDMNFDSDDFIIQADGEYSKVYLKNGVLDGEIGGPQLVSAPVSVLLNPGERAIRAYICDANWELLSEDILLYPFQEPHILPIPGIYEEEPQFIPPNPNLYLQDKWLPENNLQLTKTGNMGGFKIAGLIIKPLRYNPVNQSLEYLQSCSIRIETVNDITSYEIPSHKTQHSMDITSHSVSSLVMNPENIQSYTSLFEIDPDVYDIIMVISEDHDDLWDNHRRLLRLKGLRDTSLYFENAVSSMPGRDDAERLREAIKDMYIETGASYLLIGGDIDIIPSRWLFAMYSDAGIRDNEDYLHADLYFADLDGDYDANENDLFGEIDDEVDLYPELFVGRISVSEEDDFAYTNKLDVYENNPASDYLDNTLFLAQILWEEPYTDSGVGKDHIDDMFFPTDALITKLYQSEGTENRLAAINAIESGQNIVNHCGHGFWTLMGVGDHEYLNTEDAATIENENKYGILYSIGCWCGAFDYDDCIAEEYVMNPIGGGVGYYCNARYGWGSPGNPGFGYSDIFDREFYRALYHDDIFVSAQVLNHIKALYIPYSHWANIWRWHQFQINLMGDPSFMIRTKEPGIIDLSGYPEEIPPGENSFTPAIAVDGSSTIPSGIRVSIMKNGELIETAQNTSLGMPELSFGDVNPGDLVELIAVGRDLLPFIDTIEVSSDVPYLSISYNGFLDTLDAVDGEINEADEIVFNLKVKNSGSSDASGFRITSAAAVMVDPLPISIASGDSVDIPMYIDHVYVLRDDHYVVIEYNFEADVFADEGTLTLPLHSPKLSIINMLVEAGPDNVVMPGDTFDCIMEIKNTGNGIANDIYLDIYPGECALGIVGDVEIPMGIAPDEIAEARFTGFVNDEIGPVAAFPFIAEMEDTIYNFFIVAARGQLFDDAEGSMDNFTHGGVNDDWHITSLHANSGEHSYWCGVEDEESYQNNTDAWLKSSTFYTGENAQLSFWLYLDITNYGTDGVYIQYIYDADTVTLDYIGSGGALGILPFTTGWCEYVYDLSVPGAAPIELFFRMKTDTLDVREGCFIDDIKLGQKMVTYINPVDDEKLDFVPNHLGFEIYPNPFNSTLTINTEKVEGNASMRIFDPNGRQVDQISDIESNSTYKIDMNALPSGNYTIQIGNSDASISRKALLIK